MASEKNSKVSILTNGIIKENPVLRLVLGTCSCLAVTTAVSSALGMGAAFTFVLVCSNILISLLRNVFACKNNVVDSALDGIGMGIGYTLTVVLMATFREVLGSGTWLGFQILPESFAKISIMTQAPGAFFCYGVLMAGCVWLEGKLDARIERKSCCDIDNLKKEAE